MLTHRLVLVTAVLVPVAASVACDRSPPKPSPTSTGSSPSAIARWESPSEQAAVDAYRAMWSAFASAAGSVSPDQAALRRYAADQALEVVVEAVQAHRRQRRFVRGSVDLRPEPILVEPPHAPRSVTISDCVDARRWWQPGPGFGPASVGSADGIGGRHHTTATVKLRGGRWMVIHLLIDPASSC